MKRYDSTADTIDHITTVRERMREVVDDLEDRASALDEWTPKLNRMKYGSPEYTAAREAR